ncbi:ribbon-helix-helix protein, CopG family [Staphylococcus cohnii]|uniref:ribbon-helix-helix protein, CopG family n=1 Tax=Staphylococcus TaxID=1279 RepID=UPI00019FC443|nr:MULTISPECIES: ribbon-helix-helix protein, CopG family [Staphylococcus]EEK12548.1 Ribbon-helix-helix protein, CopG family [Staphylococcus hominis SK119]MCC5227174.1 ribbon-helix-helix protein, CopG family [Staphylococcus aureus]MDU9893732.1 ribbon-helix-helix protein, CopG family [Staphylococcus aureus]MDU9901838.1 ribbon-helix-helix protein, CopG family [Staphylococcus aureus]MDU9907098.1 ribbon-helix-helix protein, CopG family [Staphylococcus aureus]
MPRKTRLQISLTDKQIEELEKLAKEKGFTKSAILALALEEYSRKELEQKK